MVSTILRTNTCAVPHNSKERIVLYVCDYN